MSLFMKRILIFLLSMVAIVHGTGYNTVAVWQDSVTSYLYYSVYNGSSWSTPAIITTAGGSGGVSVSYNSSIAKAVATWAGPSQYPYYSTFDGASWTTPAVISADTSFETANLVYNSFNAQTEEIVATWTDSATNYPTYSIYNGTTWSAPDTISSSITGALVYTSYNADTQETVATWTNVSSHRPYYSVYDGMTWSAAALVSSTDTFVAETNTFNSFNSSSNETVATWTDNNNGFPYYSLYDGATWSTPARISLDNDIVSANDIFSCFDSNEVKTLAVWKDNGTGDPYYSAYNGSSWSTPAAITATAAYTDIFVSFNPTLEKTFATWPSNSGRYPYYSTFNDSSWSSATTLSSNTSFTSGVVIFTALSLAVPNFPSGLTGWQTENNFGVVSERFNTLQWQLASDVTSYSLYRNGVLIATLSGSATSYEDHNQPITQQTYQLTATNADGSNSSTVTIGGL